MGRNTSGTSEIEQGISKAGNKRGRWLMVELAWSWLRFQPGSQLSRWFNERFAGRGNLRRLCSLMEVGPQPF
ncbi:transposase [Burkholderia ubonensis]|uniref:transposase n=1 Tax=Burkholderia ubonensis TaxID=101571 RepID=UPI0009B31A60